MIRQNLQLLSANSSQESTNWCIGYWTGMLYRFQPSSSKNYNGSSRKYYAKSQHSKLFGASILLIMFPLAPHFQKIYMIHMNLIYRSWQWTRYCLQKLRLMKIITLDQDSKLYDVLRIVILVYSYDINQGLTSSMTFTTSMWFVKHPGPVGTCSLMLIGNWAADHLQTDRIWLYGWMSSLLNHYQAIYKNHLDLSETPST